MKYIISILFAWFSIQADAQAPYFQMIGKTPVPAVSAPTYDTTYSDTMQIITGSNAPSVAGWTTLSNPGSAPHSIVKTATVSGKTFSTQSTANWVTISGSTANNTGGENTDDGGGFFFPAAVQLTTIYSSVYTHGAKTTAQIKLSGLTPGAWWVSEIMGSRDVTGALKEGYVAVEDADGVREIRTYADGTQTNRAGTGPTGDGVYFAGNTSKPIRFWAKVDTNGEVYIWVLGTAASPLAQQGFILAGYRGFYGIITPN